MSIAQQINTVPISVPTPCIGVCQMDEISGLCKGCVRTSEEIAAWQNAGTDYKCDVWDKLPPRRARAALNAYRLPWSAIDIICMIERTLRRRWGRWVLGCEGASAAFEISAHEAADIITRDDAIIAITANGALRLANHEKTIAVAFGNASNQTGPEAIGLVLPRGRVKLPKADAFAKGGADVAAICGIHSHAQLYDLGLNSDVATRFCLRTDHTDLIGSLDLSIGQSWRDVVHDADRVTGLARPHTVVETGLGRTEIFAPPSPHPADGTHAHLTISGLEQPNELPSGWSLPSVFTPCALFYPNSRKPASAFLDGHY